MKRIRPAPRQSYSADHFAPLFAAEDRHFWFRARNRCLRALIRSLPDFPGISRVLEVGCGNGAVLKMLHDLFPGKTVVGMELFGEGLEHARRRCDALLVRGDARRSPFRHTFDLIGAFDVVEHLEEDEAILTHLHGALRPNGHLLVTVPAHQTLWSYFDEAAHHCRRYSRGELAAKLDRAGFQVQYLTEFMSWLWVPMWIKRRLVGEYRQRAHRNHDGAQTDRQREAETDLNVPAAINAAFDMALRPEAWMMARHLRIPVGTSLCAWATARDSESPHTG